MHTRKLTHLAATVAVAFGLAACGGPDDASEAHDSAAAATMPDSAGLQTTPPQPAGPMNMVDSSARAPLTADSPSTAHTDSTHRRDTVPPSRQP